MRVMGMRQVVESKILQGAVVAFGVFDGIHKGHQFLFEQAKCAASESGAPFVILSFDIDPDELFANGRLKKICTNERRLSCLEEYGNLAILNFTQEFAALDPKEFMDLLFKETTPSSLFVGENFRFGARAAGCVDDLIDWGSVHGMQVCPVGLYSLEGTQVSATKIRQCLANAQIEHANTLLGHMYSVSGKVIGGRQEGRDFGFKTANIFIEESYFALAAGVYAGYADTKQGRFRAAISLGVSPTFETAVANCEVHILDFNEDIYGQEITVSFHSFLRPMMKFSSTEELISTVMGNIEQARQLPL
jgi:riboflavin kinase / FMN adenylyltransferase